MPKPEGFTEEAWEVVERAKAVAVQRGHQKIELEDFFAAMVITESSLSLLREKLRAFDGVDAAQTDSELNNFRERLSSSLTAAIPERQFPVEPAVEAIVNEARRLAQEQLGASDAEAELTHLVAAAATSSDKFKQWLLAEGCTGPFAYNLARAVETMARDITKAPRNPLPKAVVNVLMKYCSRHLTELARQGEISPAFAMDGPKARLIRNLLKRDKRSVVITGPPGVGKTKLVEDLALRIVEGEIPELAGCEVFEFDLTEFTRGTHLAGSRAERWSELTRVLRQYPDQVILFIDELHAIMNLPLEGQAMDMANALKPLLVEVRLRIVGTTTSQEYRRHIEGDPALARRFAEVALQEPDREHTIEILRQVAPAYEVFHGVAFPRDVIEQVYEVARRWITNQAFPAKGVDLLDEIGARVRLAGRATAETGDVMGALQEGWGVDPRVRPGDISELLKDEVVGQDEAMDRLAEIMLTTSFSYGREERRGPRAVVLFAGPPGVGKTYTAQKLSEILFPGRDSLLTLDMTEFSGWHSGEHARFRLLGPPPPYVGWETGGLLTSHVMRYPVCVVLIDELEKASVDARNVLLRILDEGVAQDGRGRTVSFRGVYFVLTTNAASEVWKKRRAPLGFQAGDAQETRKPEDLEAQVRQALQASDFPPEFISRLSHILVFHPLETKHLHTLAAKMLADLAEQAMEEDNVLLEYSDDLVDWVMESVGETQDCRRVTVAIQRLVEMPLARWRSRERFKLGETVLVSLSPGDDGARVEATDEDEVVQFRLMAKVGETFRKRRQQEEKWRAARVILGSASSRS